MIINEGAGGGLQLDPLSNPGGASQALKGYQYYNQNGDVVTGNITTRSLSTPSISVNSSGLITASVTQSSGYVSSATKSATKQLTTQSGTTITPGTSQKTAVSSGRYTTGTVYVAGDADLVPGNIRQGVNIFGVTGTYEGEHNGLVSIDVTNSSAYRITASFMNSSSMDSWDTVTIQDGADDTLSVLCGSFIVLVASRSSQFITASDWNSELELVDDGLFSYVFYVPLDALGTAHIVVQDD